MLTVNRVVKMVEKVLNYLLVLLCIYIFTGCNEHNEAKTYLIGFSQCCEDPWRTTMNKEMEREAAFHSEIRLQISKANNNSSKQIDDIRNLIKSGVDLLLVSPNEAEPLADILDSIYDAGIPVVLLDRKTSSEKYNAFVGGDNYEIGKTAAQYLKELYPEGLQAFELELGNTISPARERNLGFESEFGANSKDRIVKHIQDTEGPEKLRDSFIYYLSKHTEINAVFGHTDLLASKASAWIKEYFPDRKLCVVGVDALPGDGNGIDMVDKKIISASILYPTGGVEAILISLSILNKLPFEKINKLNSIIINETNARTVHLQLKKIEGLQANIDKQMKFELSLKKSFNTQRLFIFLLFASLLASAILGFTLWKSLKNTQRANNELSLKNQEVIDNQIHILEMSEELKLMTNAKVNFFTNISHELRTPLTLILGLTDELLSKKLSVKQISNYYNQIRQNSFRLLRLINQLMDFRKAESNMMKLAVSEYNIVDFINTIAQSFRPIAEQRKIDFQIKTKSEVINLWFDPDKIDKVIFNLLSNAFKFTPEGGSVKIILLTDHFENVLKINIEDSGVGISEEEFQKIFEPFYQTKNTNFSGTGLGLFLSKSMIEMHHGSITIQSIKNKGARFCVVLPLGKEYFSADQISDNLEYNLAYDSLYDDSLMYQLGQSEIREIKPSTGYHLHIIEDNPEIQDYLKRNFENVYQVTQSFTGQDGLTSATELVPDLIICDLALPGLNGIEIIKMLKNDLRTSHIPLIILTSRATVNQQIEGSYAGADAFVTKPFNVQLLEATIQNLIRSRLILKETLNKDFVELREEKGVTTLDKDFMNKVLSYINEHFTDPLFQVNDLCKEVNLSRSQLYRKTKTLMGENISDYIQNKRLSKAELLLSQSENTVAEIAYASGFSSPDYFSTVFRQKYNVTPSQFRKGTTDIKIDKKI